MADLDALSMGTQAAQTAVPAVLLESFARNGRVNIAVLDALTPADLALSDGPGGNSVADLLAHMAGFRRGWLSRLSPGHAEALAEVTPDTDLDRLGLAFTQGDQAALRAVQVAVAEARPFELAYPTDPAHFLLHAMIHDAHHRGQIMTLLRQHGRTAEQLDGLEEATWPIWRE